MSAPTDRELMQQALEALENSIDELRIAYETDWRHGLPTRKAQLDRLKQELDAHDAAITALRDRLARQSEMDEAIAAGDGTLHGAIDHWQERALKAEALLARQEPVAWLFTNVQSGDTEASTNPDDKQGEREHWHPAPLYTAPPPAREWVGLTDEDWEGVKHTSEHRIGAMWAEAKLKERNHA